MNGFLLNTKITSGLARPVPDLMVQAGISVQNLDSLFVSVGSFWEWRKGFTILEPGKREGGNRTVARNGTACIVFRTHFAYEPKLRGALGCPRRTTADHGQSAPCS